ncbi:MAG: 50S ribosomal protein L21e [Candidatus Diapherotrites archaeon]
MPGKKARGKRAKQRDNLKKRKRATVNSLLAELKDNATVQVSIDSSVHSGLPHHRFQGKTGTVIEKRGSCYKIKLRDGNKSKELVVHPAHLKELK